MTYQNIIVAVDSEDESGPVCERALGLARAGTSLTLVHIVPPAPPLVAPGVMGSAPPTPALSDEQVKALVDEADRRLAVLVDKLKHQGRDAASLNIQHSVVRAPDTRAALHEIARETAADLIVAGSHGRHGLALLFSGSTASDILKDSPCDVLAVRITK